MSAIGYVALILALVVSIYTAIASLTGRKKEKSASGPRNGVYATFVLVTLASGILLLALFSHDFRFAYVASYSSRDMSPWYILTSFYAGNEGSLLLWAWFLMLFGMLVVVLNRKRNQILMPYVIAVVMATEFFFLLLLVFVANPFQSLPSPLADGRGLNPLLENPGMLIHPPLLLAGYVGLTIPFAFAIAALATKKLGSDWLRSVRGWTLVAWLCLGLGNLIGAQWAYVELGWGGYWSWDPVENAGLMPWLVATAFLHSAILQQRKNVLKAWNMVLIILAFNLTIFGTFITRSGILTSLHTFEETGLTPFFVTFMAIALVIPLWLMFSRSKELKGDNIEVWISRENSFLLNNIILLAAAFFIFVGTVFPALSEWLRGTKVAVGTSFFNTVSVPLFMILVLLMGICPLIGWRRPLSGEFLRSLLYPLVLAVIVGVVLAVLGVGQWYVISAISVCAFIIGAMVLEWTRGFIARGKSHRDDPLTRLGALIWSNRHQYGGYLVHLAIMFIVIGVIGSTSFVTEKEVRLNVGESASIGSYKLTYEGLQPEHSATKVIVGARLSVSSAGKPIGTMVPEKILHVSYEQPVTEVAIRSTPVEDLYIILVGWDQQSASFKILINPLVMWLWIGGGLLLVGSLIALWPERRKRQS